MKKLRGVLASVGAACLIASAAFAEEQNVQSYAHPTMFGSNTQETISADAIYTVGGKVLKPNTGLSLAGKKNVVVDAWAKNVLETIKTNTTETIWNKNMPILRSELAVVLAEGLSINNTATIEYTDIDSSYWAAKWIAKALAADVMIGYPDKTFKPDQPVTKAEVFATIAKLIDVKTDKSLIIPTLNGNEIQYIPQWAIPATKEVVASNLLADVPCTKKVASEEYLSKEQVAYLVGSLRTFMTVSKENVSTVGANTFAGATLTIKLDERLSARTSNVGEKFSATTTQDVVITGQSFPAGSKVKGEVVEISRPGVGNPGFIKIKFDKIVCNGVEVAFPQNISEAQANNEKNPNFVARLLGAPLSTAARITGVAGRTVGSGVDIVGNGLEQFGDNLSNTLVNTLSLQPIAGVKSFGNSILTMGKGIYDIGKLLVSGVFGVVYEVTDEIKYLIIPSTSNDSSLNPDEELVIVY